VLKAGFASIWLKCCRFLIKNTDAFTAFPRACPASACAAMRKST
jgi:hypothetical protein